MPPPAEFRPTAIFRRLADANVDYVVVGGIAMTFHGSDRNTFDLDICPSQSPSNLDRLGSVLAALNATPRGIDGSLPFVADATTLARTQILALDTVLGPLDVLARPDGSPPYRRLRENAGRVRIPDGPDVLVASAADLLAMKQSGGRDKDLLDAETLEVILQRQRRSS